MLFFILGSLIIRIRCQHLNTSHVILYPIFSRDFEPEIEHLNTSHVILYQLMKSLPPFVTPFKYISCYSLSVQGFFLMLFDYHLNTSHVILYQVQI